MTKERILKSIQKRQIEFEARVKRIKDLGFSYDQLVMHMAEMEMVIQNYAQELAVLTEGWNEVNLPIAIFSNLNPISESKKKEMLDALVKEGNTVACFAKRVLSSNGKQGGKAKANARSVTREYCRKLYQEQPAEAKHQTRLKAIRDKVIAFDRSQIVDNERKPLSFDQFIKTAGAWCDDLRR